MCKFILYIVKTPKSVFFNHPPHLHVFIVHMHIPYEHDSRIKAIYLLFSRNGFAFVTCKANTLNKSMEMWSLLHFSPQSVLFYLWLALNGVMTVFFEVDCSDWCFSDLLKSFYSFFRLYIFLSIKSWHSKMTGHTVSTTCTICSNEVEMFIQENQKPGYKNFTRMEPKSSVLNKM